MIFKLAIRNILRQKRRTILTSMMLVFGYLLLSISQSFVAGTYDQIIGSFTDQSTGHVQIHNQIYLDEQLVGKTIKNYKTLVAMLKSAPEVQEVSSRIKGGALLLAKQKSLGAMVLGVDWAEENNLTKLMGRLPQKPSFKDDYDCLVGYTLAKRLGLEVGEEVALISQGADGSIANDLFRVAGIFKENPSTDYLIYLSRKAAEEFYAVYNQVHEIAFKVTDIDDAQSFASEQKLPEGLVARPWQEVEKDFYKAMEADKKGNKVTEFVIMLMVAIGVLNAILMSVLERTREFGLLKAIGTTPKSLALLIFAEIQLLSLVSVVIGAFLSSGLVWYFSTYGIEYPEPIEFGGMAISGVKAAFTTGTFLSPALVVFFSATLISIYPITKAIKINPIDALREF